MRICLSLKKLQTFAISKQWITKSIRKTKSITKRNKAFNSGDLERNLLKTKQKQIKCEIRRAKNKYKEKVEGDHRENRLGSAWESMYTITGSKSNAPLKLVGYQSDIQLAQELNTFYTRFDVEDFTSEINELRNKTMCTMECNFF